MRWVRDAGRLPTVGKRSCPNSSRVSEVGRSLSGNSARPSTQNPLLNLRVFKL